MLGDPILIDSIIAFGTILAGVGVTILSMAIAGALGRVGAKVKGFRRRRRR